jgi:hypothetical protein
MIAVLYVVLLLLAAVAFAVATPIGSQVNSRANLVALGLLLLALAFLVKGSAAVV